MSHPNRLSSYQGFESSSEALSYLASAKYWTLADVKFMRRALSLAARGAELEEVPVGAVLVCDGEVIGEGFNQPITSHDSTAHAEIVALRCACETIQNYRLPPNTTMYVTLEPCTMCFGALIHARLQRLVFATYEPRAGMVGSQLDLSKMGFYNHRIKVNSELLRSLSQQQLKSFFKARRQQKSQAKATGQVSN
ncbi:tRNA adenosine(34) deaminase TadA [Psychrobacter sp. FDAARGOS_221]|uniref:tRNA adenosine(34) deaminase TadA n=1 Tax=Psychrobacter sp. FDAARGOS_221 TaxID=1975705 RepID=UPI000BB56885|nr:tRNA adenosine(34) deaminase TadA [Psychrobacter sp. FDAARGOS_221]PNK59953.1 tRNA adenosine(34) deaminase TadA [Psychrobacter sp. FDAARGOS_221]